MAEIKIGSVKVKSPTLDKVDIFVDNSYSLSVNYNGKEYVTLVFNDATVASPEIELNAKTKDKMQKTAKFYHRKHKLMNVFAYLAPISMVVLIILGIIFNVESEITEPGGWVVRFTQFPFLLVDILLILVMITVSYFYSEQLGFMAEQLEKDPAYAHKNLNFRKKKLALKEILFYLAVIVSFALIVFEVYCFTRFFILISSLV